MKSAGGGKGFSLGRVGSKNLSEALVFELKHKWGAVGNQLMK